MGGRLEWEGGRLELEGGREVGRKVRVGWREGEWG